MIRGTRLLVDFRTGWILVCVALVCGAAAAVILVGSVGSAVNDVFFRDPCATPCVQERDLEKGNYIVFEQTGSSSQVGPFSARTQGHATIGRADVLVTSSSGRALAIGEPSSSQTIDRNGTVYVGVVSFHVPESGRYRLSVDAPGATQVLVAPGLGQTLVNAVPGLVVGGLGGLAGSIGLIVLILAWTRRRSSRERRPEVGSRTA